MKNLSMYCMSIHPENFKSIKNLGYIPVGLYRDNFSKEWLRDNTGDNISKKNPFYGEYTFYYWYWKNLLQYKKKEDWVGFCHYREYWGNNKKIKTNDLKKLVLQEVQPEWSGYETIIGRPIFVGGTKIMKVLKYGKMAILKNPKAIFSKRGRTIKWQFDMFHGINNLDKAIDLLPIEDREEFRKFTRTQNSFSRGNMFITRSSRIINDYFSYIFNWLNKCEEIFGFNLVGHGKIRIYTFLAERFLPFWFQKYTNYYEWPVIFYDINKKDEKI